VERGKGAKVKGGLAAKKKQEGGGCKARIASKTAKLRRGWTKVCRNMLQGTRVGKEIESRRKELGGGGGVAHSIKGKSPRLSEI